MGGEVCDPLRPRSHAPGWVDVGGTDPPATLTRFEEDEPRDPDPRGPVPYAVTTGVRAAPHGTGPQPNISSLPAAQPR